MKIFSVNKSQIATLITLLVMIFLGACYFFIYMPANEKNVQEQRFRSLQNIDRNIHTKIENSLALLNLLIQAYDDPAIPRDTIVSYIAGYPVDKFRLSQPVMLSRQTLANPDSINFYNINVNNATGSISLLSQKMIARPRLDTNVYQMQMHFNTDQFISHLLPAKVFDQYIVFSEGKTVFQTFPAGISYVVKDSLLKATDGISGSGIVDFNVGGTDYKLFLQPVQFGKNEWVVGGLLSKERYNEEKHQLPGGIILLLVTVALVIMLAFPWIKLYQMGSKDRLTLNDAISTVVISMLLMSLLFFMFFKYNVPFRSQNTREKSKLANSMIGAFHKELDSAYYRLKTFDRLVNTADFNITYLGKSVLNSNDDTLVAVSKNINETLANFPVKQVYWLNERGDEVINWNADSVNGPHGNFKERPYFTVIQSGRPYLLRGSPTDPYYLNPLVSRTSGAFTTVMSIPSQYKARNDSGRFVAGMSFNVNSLQNAILPTGFQFAVIDNTGKVLYHSEMERSLNENLVNEFSDNEPLIASIEARTAAAFSTGYFSGKYYVYVTPIQGLPYFMVIMEDAGYKETRDMEVYSFTLSCMLFFFGFIMVQILVTFVVSSRRSFFKKQYYNTSWIGPKVSAHRQYDLAILAHSFVIVLLLVFYPFSSFLLYFFILIFSVTFTSLFLNGVFAKKYKVSRPANYGYKINSMKWLFACIILIDIAAAIILEGRHILLLLLFEILAFGLGVPLYLVGDKVLDKARSSRAASVMRKWNFAQSFTLMALTRLIISSGIPVMFFYITAFNYEQNLNIRYRQLQFAKEIIKKLPPAALDTIHAGLPYRAGIYFDSAWVQHARLLKNVSPADSIKPYSFEERRALEILNLFRLHLTDKAIEEDKFYATSAGDLTFFHNHLLKATCSGNCGTTTTVQTRSPGRYLRLGSANINYHFPPVFCTDNYCKGLLYWLLLIFVLVLFFIVLLNIIRKIFALNIPDLTRWGGLDDEILSSTKLNNLVFVIGLPGSGKLTRILERINDKKILSKDNQPYTYHKDSKDANDVFVADMMHIPDSGDATEQYAAWQVYMKQIFDVKHRLVIINHFEYNIQDAFTTRVKLNLLEQIMVQNTCRVIILSTIHPVAFLDSVLEQSYKPGTPGVPGQDLERWHVLLGHYRIVVFPLEDGERPEINDRLEQMVANETRRTHFLHKMQQAVGKVVREMPVRLSIDRESDELAFKLQMTAHYFYMYIWQSLTKEEKFLLYDHAEDNLVNSFDGYNLNMLVCKGILIRSDGSLKIFNNGFRNFILTAIGNVEAMKIKKQIKDNGNWSKLKNPMLIIILAILVFLVASQQEAYSRLITYAAALATGIPALLKLFSLFDSTKEKAE